MGLGSEVREDLFRMVSLVSAATALAALCVLLLPETGRLELESISPEEAPGPDHST